MKSGGAKMKRLDETRIKAIDYSGETLLKPGFQAFHEEISNLLKIMSHDLRGSLVSISATLKLLSRGYYGKMDGDAENRCRELLENVTCLIGVCEEYLNKVLTAKDRLSFDQEVLDLRGDIVHPVLKELSPEIKAHQIRIDNRIEEVRAPQIPITGNRLWLKTVFRNLIRNAIQYGDFGGTIAFGLDTLGSSYRLNIFNSGKPIPERWRHNLFTRTSPGGSDRLPGIQGMGVGLFLIKRILQKLGGNIWYEAKEHGSNFVFTLPIEAH
jgi:signal transduction histidine kinase